MCSSTRIVGLAMASFSALSVAQIRSSQGRAWARQQLPELATVHQGLSWRTVIPYLFLPFPEVDGGRLNTILAIPSSMARKYARCRVSAGHESSNTALSSNS